jgi:hypothetical protein
VNVMTYHITLSIATKTNKAADVLDLSPMLSMAPKRLKPLSNW